MVYFVQTEIKYSVVDIGTLRNMDRQAGSLKYRKDGQTDSQAGSKWNYNTQKDGVEGLVVCTPCCNVFWPGLVKV